MGRKKTEDLIGKNERTLKEEMDKLKLNFESSSVDRGVRLQNLRESQYPKGCEQKATQRMLGYFIGVKEPTVKSWEQGNSAPSGKYLSLLSKIYNVDADYLLGNHDNERQADATISNLTGLDETAASALMQLCSSSSKFASLLITGLATKEISTFIQNNLRISINLEKDISENKKKEVVAHQKHELSREPFNMNKMMKIGFAQPWGSNRSQEEEELIEERQNMEEQLEEQKQEFLGSMADYYDTLLKLSREKEKPHEL